MTSVQKTWRHKHREMLVLAPGNRCGPQQECSFAKRKSYSDSVSVQVN